MGYRCATCGTLELPTKEKLVAHMVLIHDSPFLEGDAEMVRMSEKVAGSAEAGALKSLMAQMR